MQQTQNYKLNLLESTDPFSPAPLNENAQKTEAALAAETAARQALDGRVQVLELHRMAMGRFPDGTASVELDFVPKVVVAASNGHAAVAIPGETLTYSGRGLLYLKGNLITCGSDMSKAIYLALA